MTEKGKQNRQAFLNVCQRYWGFDEKSMNYIEHRTSDDWKPAKEYQNLIDKFGWEDQRIEFKLDLSDPKVQEILSKSDKAFSLFKQRFSDAINILKNEGCEISYGDFLSSKVIYKKNVTKIKKVLELAYGFNTDESRNAKRRDLNLSSTSLKEEVAQKIVKEFEYIGSYKKKASDISIVLSLNPCDWLMASTGEDFTSCLDVNKKDGDGYRFFAGLPFLCGDPNRSMLYIKGGSKKTLEGIEIDKVKSRCWSLIMKDSNIFSIKWYPNKTISNEDMKAITGVNFVSQGDGAFLGCKYPIDPLFIESGTMHSIYNDVGCWEYVNGELLHTNSKDKGGQQIFTRSFVDVSNGSLRFCEQHIKSEDRYYSATWSLDYFKYRGLKWASTYTKYICSTCGSLDTGFSIEDSKTKYGYSFICQDCYSNKYFKCEKCGRTKDKEHKKSVVYEDGAIKFVCKDCYEEMKNYICSCCGTYSPKAKKANDGTIVCESCAKTGASGYIYCSYCGELTKDYVIKKASKEYFRVCKHHTNKEIFELTKYQVQSFKLCPRTVVINRDALMGF